MNRIEFREDLEVSRDRVRGRDEEKKQEEKTVLGAGPWSATDY